MTFSPPGHPHVWDWGATTSCLPKTGCDYCLDQFLSGVQPDRCFIRFFGIQKGPAWAPPDPWPIDCMLPAWQDLPCMWFIDWPFAEGWWAPNPTSTHLEWGVDSLPAFIAAPAPHTIYQYDNDMRGQNPNQHYKNGGAIILNFCPGNHPSTRDIIDYFNFTSAPHRAVGGRHTATDQTSLLLTDPRDRTYLHVTYNNC